MKGGSKEQRNLEEEDREGHGPKKEWSSIEENEKEEEKQEEEKTRRRRRRKRKRTRK